MFWPLVLALAALVVAASRTEAAPVALRSTNAVPTYTLKAAQIWRLECEKPKRFDASALQRLKDGTLVTLDDKTTRLFRIELTGDTGRLVATEHEFLPQRPARKAGEKPEPRPDPEGLAVDDRGRVYVCEESQRQVFRYDPVTHATELLQVDWAPVKRWFSADINASWEGIAVGEGKLYLANERSRGRIIVVDAGTLKVERDFQVRPPDVQAADVHYSDLCWHAGQLWVLCRESRCVLQVDAHSEQVLASFDYEAIERDPANAYAHPYPYGFVEGLLVEADNLWLIVDNNEFPRVADSGLLLSQLDLRLELSCPSCYVGAWNCFSVGRAWFTPWPCCSAPASFPTGAGGFPPILTTGDRSKHSSGANWRSAAIRWKRSTI